MLVKMAAALGAAAHAAEVEDELLVGEGLTLALLMHRVSYAGDRLLALMDRMRRVSQSA